MVSEIYFFMRYTFLIGDCIRGWSRCTQWMLQIQDVWHRGVILNCGRYIQKKNMAIRRIIVLRHAQHNQIFIPDGDLSQPNTWEVILFLKYNITSIQQIIVSMNIPVTVSHPYSCDMNSI